MSRSNKDTLINKALKDDDIGPTVLKFHEDNMMSFTYYSKVVGITFAKPTEAMLKGGYVKLEAEPTNKVDKDALMVVSLKGEKLGYIGKDDPSREVLRELSVNPGYKVKVFEYRTYQEGDKKLYKDIESGNITQLNLEYEIAQAIELSNRNNTPITRPDGDKITTINGEDIYFNEREHKYYDIDGNNLTGITSFYHQWVKEFDPNIAIYTAKAYSLEEMELRNLWGMKRDISSMYGKWIHSTLEMLYKHRLLAFKYTHNLNEKYHDEKDETKMERLGKKIANDKVSPMNYPKDALSREVLEKYIEAFDPFTTTIDDPIFESHYNRKNRVPDIYIDLDDEFVQRTDYRPEAIVRYKDLCGTIDLLEMVGDDSFNIVDYKTNKHSFLDSVEVSGVLADIFEENDLEPTTFALYVVQLNLYREMIEHKTGRKCKDLELRTFSFITPSHSSSPYIMWDYHSIPRIDMLDRLYVDSQHQRVLQ